MYNDVEEREDSDYEKCKQYKLTFNANACKACGLFSCWIACDLANSAFCLQF